MIPDLLKHFLRSNELSELFHIINNKNNSKRKKKKTWEIGKETKQNKSESAINQAYNCYNSHSKTFKKTFVFHARFKKAQRPKVTQAPSSGRKRSQLKRHLAVEIKTSLSNQTCQLV